MNTRALALATFAALAPAAAWTQVPAGAPFRVNTSTYGRQDYPDVAMKPDGAFIVVWQHRGDLLSRPAFTDVFAQRYTPGGVPQGGEFRVNAYTTFRQTFDFGGGVGMDPRGNAIVVWSDSRTGDDLVFGRRISSAGAPVGDDFRLSLLDGFQANAGRPAIAPDGHFVVAWEEIDEYSVILGGRFDPFGEAERLFSVAATTGAQRHPAVASDAAGNYTVVWDAYLGPFPAPRSVFAQRYTAGSVPLGSELQVNSYTPNTQSDASIAMAGDGSAVVVWEGTVPGQTTREVWARRLASTGAPIGVEFAMGGIPSGLQQAFFPAVAIDEAGNFVATWKHVTFTQPPFSESAIALRRFAADGTPRGAELQVAAPTGYYFETPKVASDAVGNFIVAWHDTGASDEDVFAQRFGGLFPAAMSVTDSNNGVLEVSEAAVFAIAWRNLTGAAQTVQGHVSSPTAPAGLTLALAGTADYATIADGAVATCRAPCFAGTLTGTRPAGHVDASFVETLSPDAQGQAKKWLLHVGGSFPDVPASNPFYLFVETLLHRGVTAGCAGGNYCPGAAVTRQEMAVFVLLSKEGAGYTPARCGVPLFADVPALSPFCRFIEELARRGVSGGCGGGNYCPNDPVTRAQMAVFLLRTLDPTLNPPACTTPAFADVPAASPFCRWIEELARRGVTGGCGGGNYCPNAAVTRDQMSAFLSGMFGLTLYGP